MRKGEILLKMVFYYKTPWSCLILGRESMTSLTATLNTKDVTVHPQHPSDRDFKTCNSS